VRFTPKGAADSAQQFHVDEKTAIYSPDSVIYTPYNDIYMADNAIVWLVNAIV
jgi:hypothetical protein